MTGHHFARDRAPIASTMIPTLWRYRWHCTCGATGPWRTDDPGPLRQEWQRHVAGRGNLTGRAVS